MKCVDRSLPVRTIYRRNVETVVIIYLGGPRI